MSSTTRPKLWYLNQVNLFEGLSEDEMEKMMRETVELSLKHKQLVYSPEDILDKIYILKEGEITLFRSEDGKKVIIDILQPGSLFGNIAFDQEDHGHFAEASQSSYLCAVSQMTFEKIIQAHPKLMLRLLKIIAARMKDYEAKIYELSALGAKGKVLMQLERLHRKSERAFLPEILRRKAKLTHEKLAAMTGLSRVTVTNVVHELLHEGKVRLSDHTIELV